MLSTQLQSKRTSDPLIDQDIWLFSLQNNYDYYVQDKEWAGDLTENQVY